MRALFITLLTLAASSWAGEVHAADNISLIPRIGFKNVTLVVAGGLCGRVADAMVAREKIRVGERDTAEAILIVRPVKLDLLPKRIASVSELFERLSGETAPCAKDRPIDDTAALVYEKKPTAACYAYSNSSWTIA
jgi:hypothetical protein